MLAYTLQHPVNVVLDKPRWVLVRDWRLLLAESLRIRVNVM